MEHNLFLEKINDINLGEYLKESLTDVQYGGDYDDKLVDNINASNAIIRNFMKKRLQAKNKKSITIGGGIIDLEFDNGNSKELTDNELLEKISKMSNSEINTLMGGGILSFFSKKHNFDKFLADVDITRKTVEKKIANFNITAKGAKFLAERKYKLLGEYFKIVKYKIILERAVKEPSIVKNEKKKTIYNNEISIMNVKKESIENKLTGVDTQFKKIAFRKRGFFDKLFGKKKYNMSQKLQFVLKKDNKKISKLLEQEKALSEKIIDIETKKHYYILVNKEGQDELFKQYKKLIKDYEKNKEQYEKLLDFASSSKLNDIEKIKDMKNSLQLDFIEYERLFNELDSTKKKSDNLMKEYETFLENLFEKLFDLLDIIGKDDEGMIGFMSKMKKDIREIAIYIKTFTFNKGGIGGESNFNMLLSSYECLHLYAKSSVKYLRILRANLEAVKTAFLELVIPEKIYKQLFHMDVAFQTIRFNINQSLVIVNNISPLLRSLGITVGGGKLSKKALTLSGGAKTGDFNGYKDDHFNVASLTLSVPCLNASARIMNEVDVGGNNRKIDEDDRLKDATVWDTTSNNYNITVAGVNPLDTRINDEKTNSVPMGANIYGQTVDFSNLSGKELAHSLFDTAKNKANTKATDINKNLPLTQDNVKEEEIRTAAIDYLKTHNAYEELVYVFNHRKEKNILDGEEHIKGDMTDFEDKGHLYYDFICFQDALDKQTKASAGITEDIDIFSGNSTNKDYEFIGKANLDKYMKNISELSGNFRAPPQLKTKLVTYYNNKKYERRDIKKDEINPGYPVLMSLFKIKDKINNKDTNNLHYTHVIVINVFDDKNSAKDDLQKIKISESANLNNLVKQVDDFKKIKFILTGKFSDRFLNNSDNYKKLILKIKDKQNNDQEITLQNNLTNKLKTFNDTIKIDTNPFKPVDIANTIYTNDFKPEVSCITHKGTKNHFKVSNHFPIYAKITYNKFDKLNQLNITNSNRDAQINDNSALLNTLLDVKEEEFKHKFKDPIYHGKKKEAQEFYDNLESEKSEINRITDEDSKIMKLIRYLNELKDENIIANKYKYVLEIYLHILTWLKDNKTQTILVGGSKKISFTELISKKKLIGGRISGLDRISNSIFNLLGGLFKAGTNQMDGTNPILNPPSATGAPGGTPVVSPGVPGGLVTTGLPAGMVSPYGSGSLTVNVPGYGMASYAPANNFASIDPEVLEKIKVVFIFDEYTKFKNTNLSPFISSMSVITQNMANIEKIEIIPIKDKKLPEISDNFAKKLGEIRQNNFEMKKVPSKKIEKANRDLQDVIAENDKISNLAMEILEVNSGNILSKMNDWMMDIAQGNKYRQPLDNIYKCCKWLQNNRNLEDFIKQLENKSMFKNNSYAKYLILDNLGKQVCKRESIGGNYILRNKIDMYKNDPVVKDILDKKNKKEKKDEKKEKKSSKN